MSDEIVDEATGEVVEPAPSGVVAHAEVDALTEFGRDEIGMDRALRVANRLDSIIREKGLSVTIGSGQHLRVEGWCACAAMVGVAPRTAWSREVRSPDGTLEGYEARVEVVQMSTGQVIGAAEAGCFFDEQMNGRQRWTERHAVKSMSQTRSTSKAIGQVLRWIPVLAGYSGTPAEEMPLGGYDNDRPPEPRRGGTQAPPSDVRVWGIGKNKGALVSELDDDYLSWASDNLDNKKWKAVAQAEADRRGHAPEPEKEEDPVLSPEEKKPLVAESYERARVLIDEISQAGGALRYDEENALAASIRKRAMEHLGLKPASIRRSNEAPMIAAIKNVDINADGETEISEAPF